MDDKFLCGIILGMIGGAVLVANSNKARRMVKDGQTQVIAKVEELTDKMKNEN